MRYAHPGPLTFGPKTSHLAGGPENERQKTQDAQNSPQSTLEESIKEKHRKATIKLHRKNQNPTTLNLEATLKSSSEPNPSR